MIKRKDIRTEQMEKRMERQVHQTGEEIKKAGIRRRNEGHTIFRKVGPFF